MIRGIKKTTFIDGMELHPFAAIAIIHPRRLIVSVDSNMRQQLSDLSSIPPMHGGFLLLLR